MRVFLTGAAGPLGRTLTELLRKRDDAVVGQVRRRSGATFLRRMGAEPVMSDLTRARQLADAMSGCELVIHVAQFFDFWAAQPSTFHTVNVHGAECTMNAALEAGVKRVVFVSSSLTIGERPGAIGTERTVHRGYTLTAFERSMLAAEQTALRYRAKGIEVVVVNPALVIAPGDTGWLGRLVADFVTGRRRFASRTPLGWISVRDAAMGAILAAEHGVSGSRYILAGETFTMRDVMSLVTRLARQPRPQTLPPPLALGAAALSSATASLLGGRPHISLDEARFTNTGFQVDGEHACHSLGLEYTPMSRYLPPVVASYKRVA
jgi:dihydroflavonol-4-reductase